MVLMFETFFRTRDGATRVNGVVMKESFFINLRCNSWCHLFEGEGSIFVWIRATVRKQKTILLQKPRQSVWWRRRWRTSAQTLSLGDSTVSACAGTVGATKKISISIDTCTHRLFAHAHTVVYV